MNSIENVSPLKPIYHHNPVVTLNQEALQRQGIKKFTSNVVAELNRVYEVEASTSFTDVLVTTNSSGLQKKEDYKAKKREMVNAQKELTKSVNSHFAEKAAISMLTECESKRKYHRKRLSVHPRSNHQQRRAKSTPQISQR